MVSSNKIYISPYSGFNFFRLLLLIIALSGFKINYAQECNQFKNDSLRNVINNNRSTKIEKVNAYMFLSKCYLEINLDTAEFFAQKGEEISKKNNYSKGQAIGFLRAGEIKEIQGEIEDAKVFFLRAIELYMELDKDRDYMTACNLLAFQYEIQSNYDKALEYYLMGLETAEKLSDELGIAFFYNNISNIYNATKKHDKELEAIHKASSLFRKLEHDNYYANSLINMGDCFVNLEQYDSAGIYFERAEILQFELNNYYGLMKLYFNLGDLEMLKKNYNNAVVYYIKAYENANLLDSLDPYRNKNIATANIELGNANLNLNNYNKALSYFRSGLGISRDLKSLSLLNDTYSGISRCFEENGQLDSALFYHKLYFNAYDGLQAEINNSKIAELDFQYELEQHKKLMATENELIIASRKNQRFLFLIIISTLIIIISIITFFWYYQKSKLNQSQLKRKYLELEKNKLKQDLDYKNKELTASVLHLIERNEFINQLSEKLQHADEKLESDTILDVIKEIERNTSGNLWQEFEKTYMGVHKDFHIALTSRYPHLTSNDRKICAFILMNMSTKDISSITYQSPQSIKIARYRLRKKLGLTRNENLSAFLNNLDSSTHKSD